jgi:sugar fermentation stimulation protein A
MFKLLDKILLSTQHFLMTPTLIYEYPPLVSGILVKRYKRFFADLELTTGEIITAHCPNTGPMTGVCTPGSPVLATLSDNPKRKLAYTWEAIQVNDTKPTWVGINTILPNRITKLVLEQKILASLSDRYDLIRTEVPYGIDRKSRIDFLLTKSLPLDIVETFHETSLHSELPIYLEVKNTTLTQGNIALFPDTVTTRGQKHLRELIALTTVAKPVMLFFINRDDCPYFAPGDRYDPEYGKLFREAIARGVSILPCRFEVTPTGVYYLGLAELLLEQP